MATGAGADNALVAFAVSESGGFSLRGPRLEYRNEDPHVHGHLDRRRARRRARTGITDRQRGAVGGGAGRRHRGITAALAKGADVNAKSRYDVTALIFAAGSGRLDAVKLLVVARRRRQRAGHLLSRARRGDGDHQRPCRRRALPAAERRRSRRRCWRWACSSNKPRWSKRRSPARSRDRGCRRRSAWPAP